MFDPSKQDDKKVKKKAIKQLRQWAAEIVPIDKQEGLNINVEEVQCGDPVSSVLIIYSFSNRQLQNCAPIDTIISLIWQSGGQGIFGIPAEAQEIDKEGLLEFFPVSEWTQFVIM